VQCTVLSVNDRSSLLKQYLSIAELNIKKDLKFIVLKNSELVYFVY